MRDCSEKYETLTTVTSLQALKRLSIAYQQFTTTTTVYSPWFWIICDIKHDTWWKKKSCIHANSGVKVVLYEWCFISQAWAELWPACSVAYAAHRCLQTPKRKKKGLPKAAATQFWNSSDVYVTLFVFKPSHIRDLAIVALAYATSMALHHHYTFTGRSLFIAKDVENITHRRDKFLHFSTYLSL